MSTKSELIHAMVEPEIFDLIEKLRGRETRSSYVRRILVQHCNKHRPKGTSKFEE